MIYSPESVEKIALKHGLPGEPTLMANSGMVNEAWAIGDDYVLRINKVDDCEDESEREGLIVPLLIAAGVRTPELIAVNTDCDIVPRPYTIYRRAPGTMLGDWDDDPAVLAPLYEDVARELVALHAIAVPSSIQERLAHSRDWTPELQPDRAVQKGKLSPEDREEVGELLEWIRPLAGQPVTTALAHLDIHPWNLMADRSTGRLTAILDWGDAHMADPTVDFSCMPFLAMPTMIRAYQEAGGAVDKGFAARAIVRGTALAVWELFGLDPALYKRQWWRMPPGGWPAIKFFLREQYPELTPPCWRSSK